jgi:hypothetical protein
MKKFNELPMWRKVISILCLIIILLTMLMVIIYRDNIRTTTQVLDFPDGCKEVYINGKINGTYCNESRDRLTENYNGMYYVGKPINTSDLNIPEGIK